MPHEIGAFEELGKSVSLADGSRALAKSGVVRFCLVQPQEFSAINPSLSSSVSLDDKPYHHTFLAHKSH